jgi:cytoskeletal protein CcmA (bactofilin family)
MFGKRMQVVTASDVTVIAAGSTVEGTLRTRGKVRVDGVIDGKLLADGAVSVGPEGKILGEVFAEQLTVGGCIEGKAVARGPLHVLAGGVVRGTAHYATLQVDLGGVMDGNASRVEESVDAVEISSGTPANDVLKLAAGA